VGQERAVKYYKIAYSEFKQIFEHVPLVVRRDILCEAGVRLARNWVGLKLQLPKLKLQLRGMILQNFGSCSSASMLRKSFPGRHEKEGDSLLYLVRQRSYGSQTRISKISDSTKQTHQQQSRCFDRRSHQPPAASDTDSVLTSKRSSCLLLNRLPSANLWPRYPSKGWDSQQHSLLWLLVVEGVVGHGW
jgi:hypothetical protein